MSDAETIFGEALRRPSPEERDAFLDQACGGADSPLRREIEALLSAHQRAGDFMQSPPPGVDASAWRIAAEDIAEPPEVGSVIGLYKLLEQIGEGGMGTVYMAEQLRPVRRRVALKIIKPGMDTRQVIARFEAEQQALAMMDHPNIAKVLEAGTTEAGRPYFVMELVKGIPITEYSDQNKLSPRERLELFVQVCQAVQHAHQKGIIHRDLKPTNVLISIADDGRPVPKVIDFGIAKATAGQTLTERTLFTEFRQLVGTPLYMSPEQAEARALLDVDTRSDVYSLGVLLYELLTGTTPFDKQRLAKAAHDEVRRIIREEEPPRPSTRISTLGQTLAAVSAQRQTDPKKLGAIVRGELDWIVMKALEKDRTRRYEAASGLARDVERYLENQPVEACPPSALYRLRKFARRNKLALTIVAAFVVVLMMATIISTWQAVRATRAKASATLAQRETARQRDQAVAEKQRADEQAAIAHAVVSFLNDDVLGMASSFAQAAPDTVPDPDIKVRDALDRAAEHLPGRFSKQAVVEAAVRSALGDTYRALGQYAKAEQQLLEALRLQRQASEDETEQTLDTERALGNLYAMRDEFEKAEPHYLRALNGYRKTHGEQDRNTLNAMSELADVYTHQRRFDKAEALLVECLNGLRSAFGEEDDDTLASLDSLAQLYHYQRQFDKAEPLFARELELSRKVRGPLHPHTLVSIQNLGNLYMISGQYAKAEPLLVEALAGQRKVFGADHPEALLAQGNLGKLYMFQGAFDKAEPLLLDAEQRIRRVLGEQHEQYVWALNQLGGLYQREHDYVKAEPVVLEVLRRARTAFGDKDPKTLVAMWNAACVYYEQKKYAEAELLYRQLGRAAESSADRIMAAQGVGRDGLCLAKLGRPPEALTTLRDGYERLRSDMPKNGELIREVLSALAEICQSTGRTEEAAVWRAKLAAINTATSPAATTVPAKPTRLAAPGAPSSTKPAAASSQPH